MRSRAGKLSPRRRSVTARSAGAESPTYEGLSFNLAADALYKQKRYDEALNILKQIFARRSGGIPHAPDAYYNLGNTYFQQKKLPEAAEAYKNALRRNPLDDEARQPGRLCAGTDETEPGRQERPEPGTTGRTRTRTKTTGIIRTTKITRTGSSPRRRIRTAKATSPTSRIPTRATAVRIRRTRNPTRGKAGPSRNA
ncbi:MAG: tetratricopeptide repeat protein [Alistipes indistinctus]